MMMLLHLSYYTQRLLQTNCLVCLQFSLKPRISANLSSTKYIYIVTREPAQGFASIFSLLPECRCQRLKRIRQIVVPCHVAESGQLMPLNYCKKNFLVSNESGNHASYKIIGFMFPAQDLIQPSLRFLRHLASDGKCCSHGILLVCR